MTAPDLANWPVVPEEQRPKPLYHMTNLGPEMLAALQESGWSPIDVRLLPERNEEEKKQAIQAWLQGVRLGSIYPGRGQIHFSELEARVYGLLLAKRVEKVEEGMDPTDLAGILEPLAQNKGK